MEHVLQERGWTPVMVTRAVAVAYLLGIAGFPVAGALMDRIGRRWTAFLFFVCGAGATWYAFQATSVPGISAGLFLITFFTGAFPPVTSSFTTELFPTELRANAAAWAQGLLGRLGMVGAPALVGWLAAPLGSVGNAVTLLGGAALAAGVITLAVLPETRWRPMTDVVEEADRREVAP